MCSLWKCEFDLNAPELPCTACKNKGLVCTSEKKVYGRVREIRTAERHNALYSRESLLSTFMKPQMPDTDGLTSAEWMDITRFFSLAKPLDGSSPHRSFNGAFAVPDVILYDTGAAQASPLHRLAGLVFMSYLKEEKSTVATFEYLSKFYRQALDLYKSGAVLEVIYAWYVVSVYSLLGGDSIGMAIGHCHQYCRALVGLKTLIHDDNELQYLDTMWIAIISNLFYQHRDPIELSNLDHPAALLESFEQIQLLLKHGSSLLPSPQQIATPPQYAAFAWIGQKLEMLGVYMQYYLDTFLFRVNYIASDPRETETLRLALRDICERIMQLISQLPEIHAYIRDAYSFSSLFPEEKMDNIHAFLQFPPVRPRSVKSPTFPPEERDTAIAFAYTYARLLRNMLDPNADSNEEISTDIYSSAMALCRLCASFPNRGHPNINISIPHRTLFWAGLVLTKSKFPAG